MPHITVVIPLYNKEKYIEHTLNSVLNQSFNDFELIVVDDGSTDNSLQIVKKFDDPRIRIIAQANAGVSAARNTGIKEAAAEFIAFLDADDLWKPGFLETVESMCSEFPEAGAYATAMEDIYPDGTVITPEFETIPPRPWRGLIPNYFQSVLGESLPISSSNIMIRRKVFQEIGGFALNEPSGEDQEMWCRIAIKYKIAFCSTVFVSYHAGISYHSVVTKTDPTILFLETAIHNHVFNSIELEYVREYIVRTQLIEAFRMITYKNYKKARKILLRIKTKRYKKKRFRMLVDSYRNNFAVRMLLLLYNKIRVKTRKRD